MEEAPIHVEGLLWDDWNEEHIARHGITPEVIERVLANAPQFFVNLPDRSAEYLMIGPDLDKRFYYVALVPTEEAGIYYVVTAHQIDARRARRHYRGTND